MGKTAANNPDIYARIVDDNQTYQLPANPVDGDVVRLTFDTNGSSNNSVNAGANYIDALGWSPVNQAFSGTSGNTHQFHHVFNGPMFTFRFNAQYHTWASDLFYDTDGVGA